MQRSSQGLLNVAQMFSSQLIRFILCLMHVRHPNLASPGGRAAVSWCPPSMQSPGSPGGLPYLWDVHPAERACVFTCYNLPLLLIHKLSKSWMCRVSSVRSILLFCFWMYNLKKMTCFKNATENKHHHLCPPSFPLFFFVRSHRRKGIVDAQTQTTVLALALSQQIDLFYFTNFHSLL